MKKSFDRSVDRAVELGLGLCFQQNAYGGWGLAREARLIAGIAEIARHRRDRKNRDLTTKDTKGHKGAGDRVIGKPKT